MLSQLAVLHTEHLNVTRGQIQTEAFPREGVFIMKQSAKVPLDTTAVGAGLRGQPGLWSLVPG